MADLGETFVPDDVSDDREVLPAGDALAQVFESEVVPTKAGNGKIAKFGWEIIDGPLQGRKLWTGLNIKNPNADAQKIAQRDLKRMCDAAGLGPITNTDPLHFKPMIISIVIKPGEGQYGPKNDIKGYRKADGSPPAQRPVTTSGATTQTQAQTPAAKAGGSVPWPTR